MPSPVLHAAAGLGIGLLDRQAWHALRWNHLLIVTCAAVLPDLDVLPGLLIGDPNRFHAGVSHSIGAAAIAAVVAACLVRSHRWRIMGWVFVAWTVSVALDALTVDGRPPYGVPLLWPFSGRTFLVPEAILAGFGHGQEGATRAEFFRSIFSGANLRVIAIEAGVGTAFVVACATAGWLLRRAKLIRQ